MFKTALQIVARPTFVALSSRLLTFVFIYRVLNMYVCIYIYLYIPYMVEYANFAFL